MDNTTIIIITIIIAFVLMGLGLFYISMQSTDAEKQFEDELLKIQLQKMREED